MRVLAVPSGMLLSSLISKRRPAVDRGQDDGPPLLGGQDREGVPHQVAHVAPADGVFGVVLQAHHGGGGEVIGVGRHGPAHRRASMVRFRVMVRTHEVTEPRRGSKTGAWRQTLIRASWATSSATPTSLVMEWASPKTRRW